MKLTEKEIVSFLELCESFLKKQREEEKEDGLVMQDDLSIIYRLLNNLGVWEWLNGTRRYRR